jgi:hypothetical protein
MKEPAPIRTDIGVSAPPMSGRTWSVLGVLIGLDVLKHAWILCVESPGPQFDALEYWQLAGRFLAGDWLWQETPIAYRTPGLPLFVMFFRSVLGNGALVGVQIGQHGLVVLTSVMVAGICWRLSHGFWATVLGYVACMFCLVRDWHANIVLTETLFTAALTAAILAWIAYWDRPGWRAAAISGALLGLATLVRPASTYLGWPLAAVMILGSSRKSARAKAVGHSMVMLVAGQLLLVPWYVRNERVFGEPFLTRFLGRNLWTVTFHDGNFPPGDGPATQELLALLPVKIPRTLDERVWVVSDALKAEGLADDDIDRLLQQVVLESLRRDPGRFVEQFLRRAVNYWRCVSNPYPFFQWLAEPHAVDGQHELEWPAATRIFVAANRWSASRFLWVNSVLAVAAFVGAGVLAASPRTCAAGWGLLLTLVYFCAITAAVENSAYRYRMILEPIMIAAAAGGIGSISSRTRLPFRSPVEDPRAAGTGR